MHNQKIGSWGEALGYDYLVGKGYQVLWRNLRLGNQELDLVCRYSGKIIVVEIKTIIKNTKIEPEDLVGRHKLKNLKFAGYKLFDKIKFRLNDLRFDLLALEVDRVAKKVKIRHYKGII